MKKVVIDPGHAPDNANCDPLGYFEYAGMWKLSNFLNERLEAHGINVQLTRTEHEDPSLGAMGSAARGADLFISQHSNAFNGIVQGSECLYSVTQPESRSIAARFSAKTAAFFNHRDRGAKTNDSFGVIRAAVAAGCPRVFFMESGFHDNWEDETILLQNENLRHIADIHANIILDELGVNNQSAPVPSDTLNNGDIQLPAGHVPSGWAQEAWEWAFSNGVTDGTNPQNPATREQMMQLLWNFSRRFIQPQ
ncbi:MAG: N-acetylmuramoyl-L-alanine amidase [Defluviitaleaceae bacterium]|nr:N-acetylmuramoyl-L-alanine amidase [Defluviitaleaceae bacterium]